MGTLQIRAPAIVMVATIAILKQGRIVSHMIQVLAADGLGLNVCARK